EAIGFNALLRLKNFLYKSHADYNKRKKGLITLSFFVLVTIFIIFRVESFDVIRLNILFILTYLGIILYFVFFAVFFWINKIVSAVFWMESKFNKGIIGIIGFIFLSIGISLQTALNLYLLSYKRM
ncbi:unnamed protein product, partial [marine sediment metagenome]